MLFKTCRLLSGNVRKRELTIIQRRILRRLRNKKRSIKPMLFAVLFAVGFIFLFPVEALMGIKIFSWVAYSLGCRALSMICKFWGIPGGGFLIACLRVFFTGGTPEIGVDPLCMRPPGSDEGEKSTSGSWQKYLNLSSDEEAQEQKVAEPAPQKRERSTDPGEDVGPSSVRQRVEKGSAPVAPNIGPSQAPSSDQISDEILESYLKQLGPDQLSEWVQERQSAIVDLLNSLRQQERMRLLGPLRGEAIVQDFEQGYGTAYLDRILRDLEEKGLSSPYYRESKIEKSLPTEAHLKKMDRNVTIE